MLIPSVEQSLDSGGDQSALIVYCDVPVVQAAPLSVKMF